LAFPPTFIICTPSVQQGITLERGKLMDWLRFYHQASDEEVVAVLDGSDHPLFLDLCLEPGVHHGCRHQSDNAKGGLQEEHGAQ